jgi:Fur family transcriptional regulator, ferric uptake regulator
MKELGFPQTAHASIEQRCRVSGLRLTSHQRLIVRIISEARDHPDFTELYRRIGEHNARISRPTLCRTLRLLTRNGIIERHAFLGNPLRYERAPERHHDHLIDLSTGKVCEFSDPLIEYLQKKVARELGYKLVAHRLELYAIPILRVARQARERQRG